MSLNDPVQPASQKPELSHQNPIPHVERHAQNEDRPSSIKSPHGDDPTSPEHDASHPAFQPFFTLIEDTQTGEYHHPTVHYIFSDDDTDIVTAAALRSLEAQQDALSSSKKEHEEREAPEQERSSLLPPPIPGVRENYIVLDMEPIPEENATHPVPGPTNPMSTSPQQTSLAVPPAQPQFRVTAAKSFSPAWQVLRSETVPAPTFENNEAADSAGHGLMLKIQGTGGLLPAAESGKGNGAQRLEEMMDQFAKRMSELQTIIDAVGEEEQGLEAEPAEEAAAETAAEPALGEQAEKEEERVSETAENTQGGNNEGHAVE